MSANGAEAEPDPDLPQPFDFDLAASLVEKSPFTRALDLSEKLQLTGIAYVEGKAVATLLDRETKQNYLVSAEPNAQGWKLADATASTALRQTSVKLQVGTEVVTIHYGTAQLTPTTSGGGGKIGPSAWPSDQDAIRMDENGKPYVRASQYLSDADKDKYYRGWSRESHEKFREIVMDGQTREMLLKATPQQRAEFSKKTFDKINADDKGRDSSSSGDSRGSYYRGGSGGPPSGGTSGYSPYRGGPPSGGSSSGYSPYRGSGGDSGGSYRGPGGGGGGGDSGRSPYRGGGPPPSR